MTNTTTLTVRLNNALAINGGKYITDDNGKAVFAYSALEMLYDAQVDTTENYPDLPSTAATVVKTNTASAYFLETRESLDYKQGTSSADDTVLNKDNDTTTKSSISNSANITVVNEKALFGGISKTVDTNKTINVGTQINTRDYTIKMDNASAVELPIKKVVDVLPEYESILIDATHDVSVSIASTSYPAIYTVNSYTDASGKVYQTLIVTGYRDGSTEKPLVIPGTSDVNVFSVGLIKYTTTLSSSAVDEYFKTNDVVTMSRYNRVAFYLDPAYSITSRQSVGYTEKFTTDNVVGNDWDNDASTDVRYQWNQSAEVINNISYISPFTYVTPQKVVTNGNTESYVDYVQNQTFISPGDNVAWKLFLGNSNQSMTSTIESGSKFIVVLPAGLTYAGYALDSSNQEIVPGFVSGAPTVTVRPDNTTVLEWTVAQDLPRNTSLNFTIRTNTDRYTYATYGVTSMLVPKQTDAQYFFDSMVIGAPEHAKGSTPKTSDISKYDAGLTGLSHYVEANTQVDVYGDLGLNAKLTLTENLSGNSVNSKSDNRTLTLADKNNTFTYAMDVIVERSDSYLHDLVLINRLPKLGDKKLLFDQERGSSAEVNLVGDGSFTVTKTDKNKVSTVLNEGTDYTVQYYFGNSSDKFTDADWQGALQPGRWYSAAEALADGKDVQLATANRILLAKTLNFIEGDVITASFQAVLSDYTDKDQIAFDSFGYYGIVGSGAVMLTEPLEVAIKANSMNITGVKTWADGDNQDGLRPEFSQSALTLTLSADGVPVNVSPVWTQNDDGTWTYVYADMPVNNSETGKPIDYTITEAPVVGYTTTYDGMNITNTHVPLTTTINGEKHWIDNNNQDGLRPEFSQTALTLTLYADDVSLGTVNPVWVNNNDGTWSYSIADLPVYNQGKLIVYRVEEASVSGYSATYSGYSIVNTHTPETVDINGSKVWDDKSNQDGIRPNAIELTGRRLMMPVSLGLKQMIIGHIQFLVSRSTVMAAS